MLFRNLILFRLPDSWTISALDLEEALAQRPLRPCGSFDLRTRGWVTCGDSGRLAYPQGPHYLIALGIEQKILPASVILHEARQRAAVQAEAQGHPVGRRQMRDIKARVTDELRARALSRRRVTHAWLNLRRGWLAVDASSDGRAEELVEVLGETLDGLAVTPLETRRAPVDAMAAWLALGDAPGRLAIDQELELKAVDGAGAMVRYTRHPLDGADIRAHLAAGKQPTRLGLTWNDRIAVVLHRNLHLRRVQFLDVYKDDNAQGENPQEQFDIDFALMTGELTQLVAEVLDALGGLSAGEVAGVPMAAVA